MPSWCLTEKSFQLVYLAFYCVWKLSPKGTEFLATREVAEFAKVHKLIKDEHCKKVGDVFSSYKDIFLSGYDANKTPHGFWGLLKIFHKKDPWGFPDYLQERVTKKKLMEYLEIPEEKKKATKEISKSQISSFFSVIPHSQSQPSTPLPTPSNIRGPPTNVEDGTTTLYRSHKAYIKLISVENNQVAPSFRNSFQMNIKKSNVLKEIQLNHQYYLNRLCPELLRFSPYSSTATKANTQQPKLPEITGIGQSEFNYDIVPLLYCKGCGKAKMLEGATCQNTHLMKKSTQDSFADFLVHLEKHRAESLKILNETEFDILEKRESINLFETRSIVESLQEMNTPKENTKPTTFKAWP
ncbi:hypothetical protein CYY_002625 [Polysphondylium violaceum]|uniref:Uncharacterized protein n=1 Tax=Polysphondylium violaceum TaxID=133409 RepID=A0A8J4Q7P5_9MYCE|nr:hypothetical protein CYY_002625 [Polysphondylium violaceum]